MGSFDKFDHSELSFYLFYVTVESRSESSVQDLNTFRMKLSDVNKTIHSIQSGKNSLNEVIKNISSINNQVP